MRYRVQLKVAGVFHGVDEPMTWEEEVFVEADSDGQAVNHEAVLRCRDTMIIGMRAGKVLRQATPCESSSAGP